MLFNSIAFLIFFPIVYFTYWFFLSGNLKKQNLLILLASYFFYSCWSWKFLGLLALSTIIDYFYGFKVQNENKKISKFYVWLSVINNLGILVIFKYFNFFAGELQALLNYIGFSTQLGVLEVVLPIGISFYTFHGMSYVFDIYRGNQRPMKNIVEYAVFVSFFPLLVAGPIERANHLLPQIQKSRIFNLVQSQQGIQLVILGFFKKLVIADNLSPLVDSIFLDPDQHSFLSLLFGAIGFSFQIYGDFSGYSDIASGIAKLLGFELLKNFNFPYFSTSIPDFWKRWHISLSSWFRDYLYFPLGGSRGGLLLSVRNVLIIFILSGFWHGANWTFIVWGLIHGLFYIPGFVRKQMGKIDHAKFNLAGVFMTFLIVTFAWIFFRSKSVLDAYNYLLAFDNLNFGLTFIKTNTHLVLLVKSILGVLVLLFVEYRLFSHRIVQRYLYVLLFIMLLIFGEFKDSASFIYFQF